MDLDVDEVEVMFSDIDIGLYVLICVLVVGYVSLVKLFVDVGVSVDLNLRLTSFYVACVNARVECVWVFFDFGVFVNVFGISRRMLLIFVVFLLMCIFEFVKILLGRGVAIGVVDEDK